MKVYVPYNIQEYDGCSQPLGAYSSEELAEKAYRKEFSNISGMAIDCLELDAPIDWE